LSKNLTGMDRSYGHGQRHKQAADDQDCSSGKVQWRASIFPMQT
jgi:hypothetical protein